MGSLWAATFPPKAKLTEANLEDQTGKVFIITGSSSGVGEQLASILYSHNAKIYIAVRSSEKASRAISSIQSKHPNSKGSLTYLHLDLANLPTIKASAEEFLSKEKSLNVLWLNAGVMAPPQGSKTPQGWELQLGTNNLGHYLFVHFLHPVLRSTAATAPKDSVRVVWVSSSAAIFAPKPPIVFENMNYEKKNEMAFTKYARSKAGNVLHGAEFARRTKSEGIISVSLNPGNLKSELQRHVPWWQMMILKWMLYEPIYGAYTELFAGLSLEVKEENSGCFIQPWGRIVEGRKDLHEEGLGKRYWEWTEEQVKEYY